MASEAEARIRDKAERLLRHHWPDARIIHEFELGGVRLDLAAVTPERLILGEVKSENDTLTRLSRQMEWGARVGGPVFLFCAERWCEKIPDMPYRVIQLVEEGDGFTRFLGRQRFTLGEHSFAPEHDAYDSRALMGLMLKPELYALAKPHGAKSRHDVLMLQHIAYEALTGREIRRGVMAALRARRFGWVCDDPIRESA